MLDYELDLGSRRSGRGAARAGPSVLAPITTMAREEAERNCSLSLFISTFSVGASVGLILGGALIDLLSWHWSLLINLPISAAEHGWGAASKVISFAVSAAIPFSFFRIEKCVAEPLFNPPPLHSQPRLGGLAVIAMIVGMHFRCCF